MSIYRYTRTRKERSSDTLAVGTKSNPKNKESPTHLLWAPKLNPKNGDVLMQTTLEKMVSSNGMNIRLLPEHKNHIGRVNTKANPITVDWAHRKRATAVTYEADRYGPTDVQPRKQTARPMEGNVAYAKPLLKMSGSETSSSESETLKRWNSAFIKRARNGYEKQLERMVKRKDEYKRNVVGEAARRSSVNSHSPSGSFVTITMPRFLGNRIIERTMLTRDLRPRKVEVEETEKSTDVEAEASGSSRRTLSSLVPSADSIITTIISSYPLSAAGSISYSKGDEAMFSKSEKLMSTDARNTLDLSSGAFASDHGSKNRDSLSENRLLTSVPDLEVTTRADAQNKGTNNIESSLRRSRIQLPLKDGSSLHGVETTHASKAEPEKDNVTGYLPGQSQPNEELPIGTLEECGTADRSESRIKGAYILKHGELNIDKDANEQSARSLSNSTITEALKVLAESETEENALTDMSNGKNERALSTWQTYDDFPDQEPQAGLSDGAQPNTEELSLHDDKDMTFWDHRSVTTRTMLVSDGMLTKLELQTEDDIRPVEMLEDQREQTKDIGLPSDVNVAMRRVETAYGAARKTIKIMWFLLKAVYVILMTAVATSGRAASVCATALLFIQAIYQWIINKRKSTKKEETQGAESDSCEPQVASLHSCSFQEESSRPTSRDFVQLSVDEKPSAKFHDDAQEGESDIPSAIACDELPMLSPCVDVQDEPALSMLYALETDEPATTEPITEELKLEIPQDAVTRDQGSAKNMTSNKAEDSAEVSRARLPFLYTESNETTPVIPYSEHSFMRALLQSRFEDSPSYLTLSSRTTKKYPFTKLERGFTPNLEITHSNSKISCAENTFGFIDLSPWPDYSSSISSTDEQTEECLLKTEAAESLSKHWAEQIPNERKCTFVEHPTLLEKEGRLNNASNEDLKSEQIRQNSSPPAKGSPQVPETMREVSVDDETEETLCSSDRSKRKEQWDYFNAASVLGTSPSSWQSATALVMEDTELTEHDKVIFETNGLTDCIESETAEIETPNKACIREKGRDRVEQCSIEFVSHAVSDGNITEKARERPTRSLSAAATLRPLSAKRKVSMETADFTVTPTLSGKSGISTLDALYSPGHVISSGEMGKMKSKPEKCYFPNLSASPHWLHKKQRHIGVKRYAMTVRKRRWRNKVHDLSLNRQSNIMCDLSSFRREEIRGGANNVVRGGIKKRLKNRKLVTRKAITYRETRASLLRKAMVKEKLTQRK